MMAVARLIFRPSKSKFPVPAYSEFESVLIYAAGRTRATAASQHPTDDSIDIFPHLLPATSIKPLPTSLTAS